MYCAKGYGVFGSEHPDIPDYPVKYCSDTDSFIKVEVNNFDEDKILNEIPFMDKDRTIYELQGRLNELQEEYDIQNIILQNISKTQINKEKLRNALSKLKTIQNIWNRGGEHAIEEIGVVIENHDGRGFKIYESYIDLEEGCAKLSIEYNMFQEYLERSEDIDIADTKSIYVENINQIMEKYIHRD